MNDNDLRALAAKLLKHYVADQNPVAEELVAQIPLDRMPAKVVPLITAEQRALLDQLGGAWAGIHESKAVALIAQGCGGCGSCGDGDGGGSDGSGGGVGGGSGGSMGDGVGGGLGDGLGDGLGGSMGGLGSNSTSDSMQGLADSQADAPSAAANNATSSFDSWGAMMSALGVNAQDAPADPNAATAPDSMSVVSTQSLDPDAVANMSLEDSIAAATAAANAAAASSATGTTTGVGTGAGALGGVAGGVSGGVSDGTVGGTGSGAGGTVGGLGNLAGGLAGGFGEMFGIGSAQAATDSPKTSGVADVIAAATAAANKGQLSQFLASNNTAAQVLAGSPAGLAGLQATNNAVLGAQGQQSIYGSQPGNVYGNLVGPSSNAPSAPTALTPDQIFAMNNPLADQIAITTPSNPYGAIGQGPAAPGVAGLQGQYGTVAGPSTATSSNPYGTIGQGPAGPGVVGMQGQYGNVASSLGPAIDVASLNTYNVGPAAAAPSAPAVSSPTAMPSTSAQPSYTVVDAINAPGSTPDASSGGGGSEVIRPLTPITPQSIDLATFDPTATPGVTAPGTSADATAALRKYLGLTGDPTKYGFGAEQQFYSTPTAAKGGYFDATQYFADGGMVQPLSAPTVPLVSAQPTMAFTDGAGAVGNIAQPPGLTPSDSYGFDATTASPMAPSIAAAVPTMQPGLATLAVPNVNAAPVTSQVSQNPNVGYALGNSPLSNLTRS